MRLTDYEKRVVIPAIIRVRLCEGLFTTRMKAVEILEENCERLGGVHSWSFVLWKKDIVKRAENPLMMF